MTPSTPLESAEHRQCSLRALPELLSCIRFSEVFILQGSPLLGALYSLNRLTPAAAGAILLLAAGSCALVAHVFVLNDWAGMNADLRDPNRADVVFVNRGVAPARIGRLWAALLALSLLLLATLGIPTLIIAAAIAGLSALYSFPGPHMKGVPVLNSALHFAGGLLHFLLGYSIFAAVDRRGLETGCCFALLFVAGHLTHETRDSEGDLMNGIRTNAVMFGKRRSFLGGQILFTIADILFVVLALRGAVPRLLVAVALLCPLRVYWGMHTLRAGLTFENIRWLQVRYRCLYAVIGLMMLVALAGAR